MVSPTLKALLVSVGAVSIAVAIRASVPSISDPLAPWLPPTLGSLLSWFSPPYLFVVVNGIIIAIAGIIIAIAATSGCFHHAPPEAVTLERIAVAEEIEVVEVSPAAAEAEAFDESNDFEEKRLVVVGNGEGSSGGDGYSGDCEGERKLAFVRSASTPRRQVDSSEKALVSPRLARRKAANSDHLQGGKVSKRRSMRRSNESMENIWKEIVKTRLVLPATQPVEVDSTDRRIDLLESPPSPPPSSIQNPTTFKDRTNQLREELTRDELNRRVETFIDKFNEERRLQGEESMDRFKEKTSRGE